MQDTITKLPSFLATLVAGPRLSVGVTELWLRYRERLTPAERRKIKRRDFVQALKSAGAVGRDWHDKQLLIGYAIGQPTELTVDPISKRIIRA